MSAFHGGITFCCAVIAHFVHPLIRWWISGLLLPAGHAAGHIHVRVSVWTQFAFLGWMPGSGIAGPGELFAEPSSNCRTVSCAGCAMLPFLRQAGFPHPRQLRPLCGTVCYVTLPLETPQWVRCGVSLWEPWLRPHLAVTSSSIPKRPPQSLFPFLLDGNGTSPFCSLGFRQGCHPGALLKYCLVPVPPRPSPQGSPIPYRVGSALARGDRCSVTGLSL